MFFSTIDSLKFEKRFYLILFLSPSFKDLFVIICLRLILVIVYCKLYSSDGKKSNTDCSGVNFAFVAVAASTTHLWGFTATGTA